MGAPFSDRPPVADPRHGFSPTVTMTQAQVKKKAKKK
jgi:hypothetical protein